MRTPFWITKIKTPQTVGNNIIPIYSPVLDGNEKKYVLDCLDNTWLSSKGQYVQRFEAAFSKYCHSAYAISCSSGTSALFLALRALNIKKGDEVIIPTFTMISTAFAVSYTGAGIKFIDCQLTDGNIDAQGIENAINRKTKAIMPVHVYGNPSNLNLIHKIAKKYHIKVIEDAAEAFGSTYKNRPIGGLSDFSTFSLYANKIVTTGEGGMITTNSKQLYERLKNINNYSFSQIRHFWHQEIGYNFRLSNLQAAVGLAQLENAQKRVIQKQKIANWYNNSLNNLKNYFVPLSTSSSVQSNYWHIAYRIINKKYHIQDLRLMLGKNGIETRGFFIPIHLQPPYRRKEYTGKYPNSEELARTGILLPSGPGLNRQKVEFVCEKISQYFKK